VAFLPNSRYFGLSTVTMRTAASFQAEAVKLRRLPAEAGDPRPLDQHDRLDILAQQLFSDGTRFWHIADANGEMEANALVVPGRVIRVPRS
jgi:hypothetical protein